MTPRERKLAVVLGAFIALMVFGLGGYVFVYLPVAEKNAAADALEQEIAESEAKVARLRKDLPRVASTLKRSLPADPTVALQEYDAVLSRLLREAKVPLTGYSLKPKAVESRTVGRGEKKPPYTRVALTLELRKIDLGTLVKVLERYYQLNLLQQITKFHVKRVEEGGARRGTTPASRADLSVTLVTEGIILDGAEKRRTLLPIPVAMGAAGGGAGYEALALVPQPARAMTPVQYAAVLATNDREYNAMLAQDVFHGPLPAPPKEEVVVEAPKEDTSAFIRLTGVGRNSDGTGSAIIEDVASHQQYAIELTRKAGQLVPEVVKSYFLRGAKKSYSPAVLLDISEASSGTARKFRVIGLDGDSLVLGELPKAGSQSQGSPRGGQFGGFNRRPSRPSTPPGAAAAGAVVAALPQEKYFLWKYGEPLSHVKELSPRDAREAIRRATNDPADPEQAVTAVER
jgi:hypothetical protein